MTPLLTQYRDRTGESYAPDACSGLSGWFSCLDDTGQAIVVAGVLIAAVDLFASLQLRPRLSYEERKNRARLRVKARQRRRNGPKK